MPPQRPVAPKVSALPYRKLQQGRDYWILDDALADPHAIRERLLQRKDWTLGAPYRQEAWPGMRALPALLPDELESIESWVREQTGAKRLTQRVSPEGTTLNNNCVQIVGADEGSVRPHTDSRLLCNYAAVLYLSSPSVPPHCGTSFFRVRQANGQPGGNYVSPPHATLVEALGMRVVPPNTFVEDLRVDHRFNRLLVYRSALIHSATAYWGGPPSERRMTVVFFWMG